MNQEEIVLKRGAASHFIVKLKIISAWKPTSARDLVFVSFCALGNALQQYRIIF